jgi:hypothetical protein
MPGIGGDRHHHLGRDLEQEIVDHGLVLVGDVGDRRWQREHHVIVPAPATGRPRAHRSAEEASSSRQQLPRLIATGRLMSNWLDTPLGASRNTDSQRRLSRRIRGMEDFRISRAHPRPDRGDLLSNLFFRKNIGRKGYAKGKT